MTKAQQQMIDDGLPPSLLLTTEQRRTNWENSPPKPLSLTDPVGEAQRKIRAEQKRVRDELRIAKLKAGQARKAIGKIDIRGKRWDQRTGRWVSATHIVFHRSRPIMAKVLILPLDEGMQVLERGKTSLDEGATPDQIADKVRAAAKRAGKKVAFVWVTFPSQPGRPALSEWHIKDGKLVCVSPPTFQIPEPAHVVSETAGESATSEEESVMAKKANGTKAKKAKGEPRERKPGVIAAIIEAISRKNGASIVEIVEILCKKFPDRKEASMTSTAKIQANKNATHKDKSETRGLIYYKA